MGCGCLRRLEFVVLTGYPARAVIEDFFLPNGDNLFYPVHSHLTGLKRLFPMG